MKDGQCLLVPEVEVNTHWTSLADDLCHVGGKARGYFRHDSWTIS
ncbi:MAG: hypothetical protein ABFD06_07555 [Smithella sp.]